MKASNNRHSSSYRKIERPLPTYEQGENRLTTADYGKNKAIIIVSLVL